MTIFTKDWYKAIDEDKANFNTVLKSLDEKTRNNFYKAFEDLTIDDICDDRNAKAKLNYWTNKLNVSKDYIFSYLY